MKNSIFTLLTSLVFVLNGFGQDPLQQVVVEEYYNWEQATIDGIENYPDGCTTYRVYALMDTNTDQIISIYGDSSYELSIGSSNDFVWFSDDPFAYTIGGSTLSTVVDLDLADPSIIYTSFLTIRKEFIDDPGCDLQGIYSGNAPTWGPDYNSGFTSGDLPITWYSLCSGGENNQGQGPDNAVLILQITSTGTPQFNINLGVSELEQYTWNSTEGEEKGLVYPQFNCDDPLSCNYNLHPELETNNDFCSYICYGCTDINSCNYNSYASIDDASCEGVLGCIDPEANNYNADATCDNDDCIFLGCTDINSCNFSTLANSDDGSCEGDVGCLDIEALNYNVGSDCDGGCLYDNCGDTLTINFCDVETNFGELIEELTESMIVEVVSGELVGNDFIGFYQSGFIIESFAGTAGDTTDISGYLFQMPPNGSFFSWSTIFSSGTCSSSETDPVIVNFYCGGPIVGCMDPFYCNFEPSAITDDGSCSDVMGCVNSSADNYDPLAACNDDSCVFLGCTNANAINYNIEANIEDGSCLYGLFGKVYLDGDQDGILDIGDPGIENWLVEIPALGISTFTVNGGEFTFPDIDAGIYQIQVSSDPDWTHTTSSFIETNFDGISAPDVYFGLAPINNDYSFFNTQECCIFMPWVHCDLGFFPGVWFHNGGTAPLNGTISITWEDWLGAEPQAGSVVPEVLEVGYCEWQLNDYQPGSSDIFRIHVLGPGPEFFGQFVNFDIGFDFTDFNGEDNFQSGILLNPEIVCAYDPNDKYAEPEGYSEEHFILPDEEIQYRIRFQNTGNFPAGQVIVRDTLSPLLDFETFDPGFASHNMNTSFNSENGAIEFAFYDINLPDSTSNEEESHGFLVFNIRPLEGLEFGTIIENTGHIYFDGNPAIVTNTTWHTIYECTDDFSDFNFEAPTTCVGDLIFGSTQTEYIEDYLWEINGAVQINAEDEMTYEIPFAQEYEVVFTAMNPICENSTAITIEAFNNPSATISGESEMCAGEELTLQGNGAEEFDWGPYGTGSSANVTGDENFTVELEVTDENGCSDSESIEVLVNPLPEPTINESDFLISTQLSEQYQWFVDGNAIEGATNQNYQVDSDGEYFVQVWDENGCSGNSNILNLTYIGVDDFGIEQFRVYPNPASDYLIIEFEETADRSLKIVTIKGAVVYDFTGFSDRMTKIDTTQMAGGLYHLQIIEEDRIFTSEILIIK